MTLARDTSSRCMAPARAGATTVSGCRRAMDEAVPVHRRTEGTWVFSQCLQRESLDDSHDNPTACLDQWLGVRQRHTDTLACSQQKAATSYSCARWSLMTKPVILS